MHVSSITIEKRASFLMSTTGVAAVAEHYSTSLSNEMYVASAQHWQFFPNQSVVCMPKSTQSSAITFLDITMERTKDSPELKLHLFVFLLNE